MLVAQGLFWKVALSKGTETVVLSLTRESLPDTLKEVRDFRVEIPLDRWHRMLRHVRTDRKLAGGILLDFARPKDQISAVVSNDRVFGELQRVVLEATASLVERGCLTLSVVESGAD